MKEPEIPPDEKERLEALGAYDILDSEPEQAYDDLVRIVSHMLDMPIALVSLVDAERQWFKARVGLDAQETSREISFCGHAVAQRRSLVVENALELASADFAEDAAIDGAVRALVGHPAVGQPHRVQVGRRQHRPDRIQRRSMQCLTRFAAVPHDRATPVEGAGIERLGPLARSRVEPQSGAARGRLLGGERDP